MDDKDKVFLQTLGRFIQAQVRIEIAPLTKQIEELKAENAELRNGGIKYHGIWQRASEYKRGSVVTFDGSMFCAVADVQPAQVPGKCEAWQLAVKGR